MLKISLNLLPPQKKDALRQGFLLAYVQTMVFLFFLVAVMVAAVLIPVRIMLKADYDDIVRQTSPEKDEFAAALAEIRDINAFLKRIDGLQTSSVPWSATLRSLTDLAPAGVHLETLAVGAHSAITLSGTAETRDDLLTFEERLKSAPFLSKVESPLSNILQKKNVKFEIQVTYRVPAEPAAK
ncbi:MAG: PilN domain-containing protein [Patescibacteria group bacterium]